MLLKRNLPDNQMELQFGSSADTLEQYFSAHLTRPVSLVLTDNSTSMLSVRVRNGMIRVRIHRMFAQAGKEVLEEIALFLKRKKGTMPLFRDFIRQNREKLAARPPKKVSMKTGGRYHDLAELFDRINKAYFDGTVNAAVTWGTANGRIRARRRTLGSYNVRSNIIRINPLLDKKTVPSYYVAFVVYHEMLHACLGISEREGRRRIHTREFRRREKQYQDYEKAVRWEQTGKA